QSFSFYKYYFPYRQLPDIYTFISGFNQSVVTDEKILGIGLDKYFGDTCDFYTRLAWPNYIKKNMQPEKIVSDCMKAWAFMEFDSGRPNINQEIIKNNAINHMLFHGKIMYFLDAVLPYEEDSLKIGFSNNQLEWCQNNEAQMWDYLIENKLLFSTELLTIRKLVEDAPFTSYFTDQSPGRAGVWIGWQIIKSYMKKNNCSLEELMLENDYQKIMTISGYNPKQ
ncbi:gliding motility protein GldB, partial [Bacteroidota bacterium]